MLWYRSMLDPLELTAPPKMLEALASVMLPLAPVAARVLVPVTSSIVDAYCMMGPVPLTLRVPTVVLALKVVAELVPVVVVVNEVPTVPDRFNAPADVSAVAPVLSTVAVKAA
jgi:hypothetical protein